jgi:hypothetical protein
MIYQEIRKGGHHYNPSGLGTLICTTHTTLLFEGIIPVQSVRIKNIRTCLREIHLGSLTPITGVSNLETPARGVVICSQVFLDVNLPRQFNDNVAILVS